MIAVIRQRASVLAALLIVVAGCAQPHQGWEPPLEETSTGMLQSEVDEVLKLVEAARKELPPGSDGARQRLSGAARRLGQLSAYYLPMLEARQHTYDAHRFFYHGETLRAEAEIDKVQKILAGIEQAGGGDLFPALSRPVDLVGEAKAAMRGAPGEAPGLLKELAVELNSMGRRGELVLPKDWPTGDDGKP